MDGNGVLYVVSENGGGDIDHPQLWVYAPSLGAEPGADRARAEQSGQRDRGEHQHRGAGSRWPTSSSPTTDSARTT